MVMALLFSTFMLAALAMVPGVASAASSGGFASYGGFIVVLNPGASPAKVAADYSTKPYLTYSAALNGFAANIELNKASRLASDPRVEFVANDVLRPDNLGARPTASGPSGTGEIVPVTDIPQFVPRGVSRIGTLDSPTAHIDGVDDPMNVDIAVIDSGVQSDQSDLRVVGGVDCSTRGRKPGEATEYEDLDGHGTHVAGIAAAKDNAFGVVGVAPGARVWAVRVTDGKSFLDSYVLCGLDWVAAHASTVEVANMSLSDYGSDDHNCGHTDHDPVHVAVCAVVTRGVTLTASAGNDATDVSTYIPAAYSEVIAVSALADSDGKPGGLAQDSPCGYPDDVFAFFSNFGASIGIAAPGTCIPSTYTLNQVYRQDGTSMAAPHVAGAALLYKARHPSATPRQVRNAILASRERYAMPGDPDGINEGVLNVAGW
jgi:subtilisin family serine protease